MTDDEQKVLRAKLVALGMERRTTPMVGYQMTLVKRSWVVRRNRRWLGYVWDYKGKASVYHCPERLLERWMDCWAEDLHALNDGGQRDGTDKSYGS